MRCINSTIFPVFIQGSGGTFDRMSSDTGPRQEGGGKIHGTSDGPEKTRENLEDHFEKEKGPISWKELELFFASGKAIYVDPSLDLVGVAVHMALDDSKTVESWITEGRMGPVENSMAAKWNESNPELEAVVVSPWVLVQEE